MYTLFREASNLTIQPLNANIYLYFLERSVNKAIIQHKRIQHDKLNHGGSTPIQSQDTSTILLADIHYYLVNWTEFFRYYLSINELQPMFLLAPEQIDLFKNHKAARNFIEHRNERIKPNNNLGTFHSDVFVYDGKSIKVDKSDLDNLKKSYLRILKTALDNFECYRHRDFYQISITHLGYPWMEL